LSVIGSLNSQLNLVLAKVVAKEKWQNFINKLFESKYRTDMFGFFFLILVFFTALIMSLVTVYRTYSPSIRVNWAFTLAKFNTCSLTHVFCVFRGH